MTIKFNNMLEVIELLIALEQRFETLEDIYDGDNLTRISLQNVYDQLKLNYGKYLIFKY